MFSLSRLLLVVVIVGATHVHASRHPSEPQRVRVSGASQAHTRTTVPSVEDSDLQRWKEVLMRNKYVHQHTETGYVPVTIPPGVNCNQTQFCDKGTSICVPVCAKGTVEISEWLEYAQQTQRKLSETQPLCYSQLPGSHNSAITMADGYGSEDAYLTGLLQKYFDDLYIRTNDQYLSLTDQMRLGLRVIELDTHYFDQELHIAHCGGAHFKELDKILREIATKLRLNITWDSETIGCDPSLSAIPTTQQRSLESAFQEVQAFMNATGNDQEFLLIFFDDQMDLETWGVVPDLIALVTQYFGPEVFTPADKTKFNPDIKIWPSIKQMLAMGKRYIFMSGADYGSEMSSLLFHKESAVMCNWQEPDVQNFTPFPKCTYCTGGQNCTANTGTILRVETSEIVYGPILSSQPGQFLNNVTIPPLVKCGVNFLCPDLVTPARVAAQVWTWDTNEPITKGSNICAILSASDGRWRASTCTSVVPVACQGATNVNEWQVSESGTCPQGTTFAVPVNGYQNEVLREVTAAAGVPAVKLNYHPE